ncbi:MAG: signal peptidase I, partial [Pirellulaceae bacterium]
MVKRNFPEGDTYMEPTPIGTWIRSPGVRETVESVLIAILLALLFRFFEAEAFIIPTGSMAPDLQGLHVDVQCPKCKYQYRSGVARDRSENIVPVEKCACPICQYPLLLRRHERRDHREFSGDRILVNKFAYDFGDPERYDVIVFKYPNNGKQNFIKRLIGLPNEGLLIEYGDIHTWNRLTGSYNERQIARKSPRKLKAMLQLVDDTNHIAEELIEAGWPSRWNQWNRTDSPADWQVSLDPVMFTLENDSDDLRWLRYRHLQPRKNEWEDIEDGELPTRMSGEVPPGELITDHYAYNDSMPKLMLRFTNRSGMHWVGDLAVEAHVDMQSDSGTLILEVVEGGVRFSCTIDVASGAAKFAASDPAVTFNGEPQAQTAIRGSGKHVILFANADDKLFLWVDGRSVDIPGAEFTRTGEVTPQWSASDPGDAEPAAIGGRNISMNVSRLKLLRDIYYTSK